MADRFFSELPLGLGETVLEGPEAHHLAHVRRLKVGERVTLFNGDGRAYRALVDSIERKAVRLRVDGIDEPRTELGFRLEVAAVLPKGDRADYLIEKLTELGVTNFVPLQTERSIAHPRESRIEKLRRAVIEASKQCGRNVLMRVHPLAGWSEYCCRTDLPACRLIAHPSGPAHGPEAAGTRDVVYAVGPEGGFTEQEVELACRHDWRVVSLGPRILRIETAAVVLAAWEAQE